MGTFLDNDSLRISIALRLGAPIVKSHNCVCGSYVNISGTHGLCCQKSAGRRFRHDSINDILKRALVSAKIPSILEPQGTCRDDGKRPDGLTMVPWRQGKCMIWDVTCVDVDTLAPSHVELTSNLAGSAANEAEKKKCAKYSSLSNQFIFVPVGFETFGPWGYEASKLVTEIGKRLTEVTGEKQATSDLKQRISMAI